MAAAARNTSNAMVKSKTSPPSLRGGKADAAIYQFGATKF
jgi:hypothetical protein